MSIESISHNGGLNSNNRVSFNEQRYIKSLSCSNNGSKYLQGAGTASGLGLDSAQVEVKLSRGAQLWMVEKKLEEVREEASSSQSGCHNLELKEIGSSLEQLREVFDDEKFTQGLGDIDKKLEEIRKSFSKAGGDGEEEVEIALDFSQDVVALAASANGASDSGAAAASDLSYQEFEHMLAEGACQKEEGNNRDNQANLANKAGKEINAPRIPVPIKENTNQISAFPKSLPHASNSQLIRMHTEFRLAKLTAETNGDKFADNLNAELQTSKRVLQERGLGGYVRSLRKISSGFKGDLGKIDNEFDNRLSRLERSGSEGSNNELDLAIIEVGRFLAKKKLETAFAQQINQLIFSRMGRAGVNLNHSYFRWVI